MTVTALSTDRLEAIKARQRATWASGDYSAVATLIVPVAELLVDFADLTAGSEVLDVATGSGNAALAAARLQARVTGVDYVPELLERGRRRAAAEGLSIEFREADAEHLPFADASFDAVTSVFGSMFAPDHERTAGELLRVTRPGGTIGLASWTPSGFLGDLFRAVAEYAPPPAGIASPMLWGTADHVESIFGPEVEWVHATAWFTFRFRSPEAFVDYFAEHYGPTLKALAAAGGRAPELRSRLARLVSDSSRLAGDGPVAVRSTYLMSRGTVLDR